MIYRRRNTLALAGADAQWDVHWATFVYSRQ